MRSLSGFGNQRLAHHLLRLASRHAGVARPRNWGVHRCLAKAIECLDAAHGLRRRWQMPHARCTGIPPCRRHHPGRRALHAVPAAQRFALGMVDGGSPDRRDHIGLAKRLCHRLVSEQSLNHGARRAVGARVVQHSMPVFRARQGKRSVQAVGRLEVLGQQMGLPSSLGGKCCRPATDQSNLKKPTMSRERSTDGLLLSCPLPLGCDEKRAGPALPKTWRTNDRPNSRLGYRPLDFWL
jgi:hypothetical protein